MAKNSRALLQTLILSVCLNVVLAGIIFYFFIQDNPLHFSYAPKNEKKCDHPPCPLSFLSRLQTLEFTETLQLLKDKRDVKDGYAVRDFALGALATFHNFDVKRALNQRNLQKRIWTYESGTFTLFPGLSDDSFQRIEHFATVEEWPLTTKGLFLEIQKNTLQESSPELITQFCHSPEFILVQTLFGRKKIPIQKRVLLNFLVEGGWENLEKFYMEQEKVCDLSDKVCREFLMHYFSSGSKTAAYLLLLTEESYVLNHFDDEKAEKFVELLTVKTKEACGFLQKLAVQDRKQIVVEKAAKRLEDFGEKEIASKYYNRPSIGELRPKFRDTPPISVDPRTHIIAEGESLWLIARRYKVSLEKLMEINGLQSSNVRPGKLLKIPPN